MPLDTFNRTLAVGMAVAVAISGGVGLAVATALVEPASVAPDGWFRQPLLELSWLDGLSAWLASALLGATTIGAIYLLLAEILPYLRRRYIPAGNGTNREFAVREGAVERMVRYAAAEVDGVYAVEQAHVRRGEHGLEITCTATLEPDALAGRLAPLLEARLCNAVYSMTGLPVGQVKLRIQHAAEERELV